MHTCPYCDKEFAIPDIVELNLEAYGGTARIATPCCSQPIIVRPRVTFSVAAYTTRAKEDDWGTPYANPKKTA